MMPKNAGGLIKPKMLGHGDTIAVISPSWGCAGAPRVRWQYRLGAGRLEELGLNVVTAPNALRGTKFLHENPCARGDHREYRRQRFRKAASVSLCGDCAQQSEDILRLLRRDDSAPLLPPHGIVDILRRQSADNGRRSAGLARIQPRKL